MSYDVLTYLRCRNIPELERRFSLLEPLVHIYCEEYGLIQNILANPEYGQIRLQEVDKELKDLREDMTNIATAINILMKGDV